MASAPDSAPLEPKKPRTFWGRISLPTRILLGMVLGIAVGLLVGPRSCLLAPDGIHVVKQGGPAVRMAPSKDAAEIELRGKKPWHVPVLRKMQGSDGRAYYEVRVPTGNKGFVKGYIDLAAGPEPTSGLGHTIISYIKPAGTLFLRLIKMVIVPLVFASLLMGVASLGDIGKLGKMGGLTLGYFLLTTAVAIAIGLVVANTIRPQSFMDKKDKARLAAAYSTEAKEKTEKKPEKSTMERIVEIVPDHPIESAAKSRPDMLQVIFFALICGIAFILIPADRARPAIEFFDSLNEAMIKIVQLVMELAPFGVFALLAEVAGTAGGGVLRALGVYTVAVIIGLLIHATFTYGGTLLFLARYPIMRFLRGVRPAQLIAFSTSSSSATLPVSIKTAKENLGVTNRAASFVLPLGATVNMDGTALYQGIAAVFIAQVSGFDLTIGQQLQVLLTATLASVGAAGVPGAGIITLALVLASVGVPEAGIALILGVDRLLDMFRTSVNVTGDLTATVLVAQITGEFQPASTTVTEVETEQPEPQDQPG